MESGGPAVVVFLDMSLLKAEVNSAGIQVR